MMDWLEIHPGDAPLIVAFPHTGTAIPAEIEGRLVSPWLARKDTDWWLERLYDFAQTLGATTIRTHVSRTMLDVNRDPSGASLYPGQATTGLCPVETFDGEPLYRHGLEPDDAEINSRRASWFYPYHAALAAEVARALAAEVRRLRAQSSRVVLYDAHSIRQRIPRLFDGELPIFNIGTNNGSTCDPGLTEAVREICAASPFSHIVNGRFRGGWTTRHYGRPAEGVHAIQMELACNAYLDEPDLPNETNWPTAYEPARAEPLRTVLQEILTAALAFARGSRL
jgi:N-formylglutamate deformylase